MLQLKNWQLLEDFVGLKQDQFAKIPNNTPIFVLIPSFRIQLVLVWVGIPAGNSKATS